MDNKSVAGGVSVCLTPSLSPHLYLTHPLLPSVSESLGSYPRSPSPATLVLAHYPADSLVLTLSPVSVCLYIISTPIIPSHSWMQMNPSWVNGPGNRPGGTVCNGSSILAGRKHPANVDSQWFMDNVCRHRQIFTFHDNIRGIYTCICVHYFVSVCVCVHVDAYVCMPVCKC